MILFSSVILSAIFPPSWWYRHWKWLSFGVCFAFVSQRNLRYQVDHFHICAAGQGIHVNAEMFCFWHINRSSLGSILLFSETFEYCKRRGGSTWIAWIIYSVPAPRLLGAVWQEKSDAEESRILSPRFPSHFLPEMNHDDVKWLKGDAITGNEYLFGRKFAHVSWARETSEACERYMSYAFSLGTFLILWLFSMK